jgi:hypothetical protein
MDACSKTLAGKIESDGFALVPGVYPTGECQHLAAELQRTLEQCADDATSLRRANGAIYGARNLIDVFPAAAVLWRRPRLLELLSAALSPACGLVRGLYFDKPPDCNWSLPWHQDLTIAVMDHAFPSALFKNRTMKAGVPHVEAPDEILHRMLTLRIHLDDAAEDNGPLQVLPATHIGRDADAPFRPPVTILAAAGDVLAMRPLLSHSSGVSAAGTSRHRRVIHLEFAADPHLPDGYRWRWFVPI